MKCGSDFELDVEEWAWSHWKQEQLTQWELSKLEWSSAHPNSDSHTLDELGERCGERGDHNLVAEESESTFAADEEGSECEE